MRPRLALLLAGAAVLALPALAQESILPPGFDNVVEPAKPATPSTTSTTRPTEVAEGLVSSSAPATDAERQAQLPVLIELPGHAKRNPFEVGRLDPAASGMSAQPWGAAGGTFLSTLLRRMETPLPSRWVHIQLRNALLARSRAPQDIHPVDWVAERAWLLLRMGEADAAAMLVAGVDTQDFTPKMTQVAVQAALANSDPLGLCPLDTRIAKTEKLVFPLVQAMCSSLAGEPEAASAQIDAARRRGSIGGIDLALAQKVVGTGSDTGRAVTIEWEPVDRLTAWRFGLASATGMTFPERLTDAASPQLRAWQARAPLIAAEDRQDSALVATGLGVFSGQALTDFLSLVYDSTDANDLPATDAWQLRLAFTGRNLDARLGAMRRLWSKSNDYWRKEAYRAVLGRASSRIAPNAELQADAPMLISSMLAAGLDSEAARWAGVIEDMDDQYADQCWAMLALGAPANVQVRVTERRINAFIDRDESEGRKRSALLIAGLVGLGKIDEQQATQLSGRNGFRLGHRSRWTGMIDGAARRGQGATVAVLIGTGFQAEDWRHVPAAHLFHAVAGLRNTGQQFAARMIAAEALSRTA